MPHKSETSQTSTNVDYDAMPHRSSVPSHSFKIWIAGSESDALAAMQDFVDEVGLCVTITPTTYVYTGGAEKGVVVGLINYPRFPSTQLQLESMATRVAYHLLKSMNQQSCTVEGPERSVWISYRDQDVDK